MNKLPTEIIFAIVLALLTLVPKVGWLFGFVAIILAIDSLVKIRDKKFENGKWIAIAALILAVVLIVVKIVLTITGVITTVGEFSNLNYEDAVEKCKTTSEDYEAICYMGIIVMHSNDSRVLDGQTCELPKLDETKAICFTMIAGVTNNTQICSRISLENVQLQSDFNNYCLALASKDASYCANIVTVNIKSECIQQALKLKIRADPSLLTKNEVK